MRRAHLLAGPFSIALVCGLAPQPVAAATVGCGRVTTFAAPNSSGALNNGDGWLILAKPDGTSEKVIVRSGTLGPSSGVSGYVCVGIDGLYFTGLVAPGTAGYIPEPVGAVPGTGVNCGIVAANPFTSGQLSGPRTLQLLGALAAFGEGIFSVPATISLPPIGSYLCARFEVGGPSRLTAILRAGDPGYVAGLPNTSTAPAGAGPGPVLLTLTVVLAVAGAWIASFARRAPVWR